MRTRFSLVAIASTLFAASAAFGWGGEGHQITCLIAEAHLTPAAKANVEAILGRDDKGQQAQISDAEVANWADRVRREKEGSGPYHYVDIPIGAGRYVADRDGNQGNNVIDKLASFSDVLRDTSKPREQREEALRWVVHLVGDMHQPLHCAERDHDRGGNSVLCFLLDQKGKATNLHSVWDSGLLRLIINRRPIAKVADELDQAITPKQISTWQRGTPTDWANESHAVAAKVVYAGIPADGPPPRLDQKYVDRANPAVVEQLKKGGIRLSMILNKCFPTMPKPDAPARR